MSTLNGDSTKLFGILGYPIKHTFSPAMHNAAFKELGINATYVPFPVTPDHLEIVLKTLPQMGVCGVNVTIPHKQTALTLMDTVSEEAKLICAINTIVFKNSKMHGYNTDSAGFRRSLEEHGFNPKEKRALILGAGGAARAVAVALAQADIKELYIYNRTRERANILAQHIDHHFTYCSTHILEEHQTRSKEDLGKMDLVVNATSLGLDAADPIPISPIFFKSGTLFYDLIYHAQTNWLKVAKKSKMHTLNGLGMLVHQGALSFELWTGKKAPLELMQETLKKQLQN